MKTSSEKIEKEEIFNSNLLCRTLEPTSGVGFSFIKAYGDKMGTRKYVKYRPPKIVKSGKKWYVEYHYRIPDECREDYGNKIWQRFKVYEEINRYRTIEYANILRNAVEDALADGYSPFNREKKFIVSQTDDLSPQKTWTIQQAILYFVQKWQERGLEKQSIVKYERSAKGFITWLSSLNLQHEHPDNIRTGHVERYLIHMKTTRGWTNRGFNNELNFLNTIFLFMQKRAIIRVNPCIDIRKQKTITNKHKYYDDRLFQKVRETLKTKDPYLYFACQVVYYLCIRSEKELRSFKVGNIFPDRKQVLLKGADSKSDTDRYIPMPDEMLKIFEERKILEYDSDDYVFSVAHKNKFVADGTPGKEPFGNGFFSKRFARVRKELGLSFDYTIYGFKHTRIIHLKIDGAMDADIMSLTGHKDFSAYAKYLRDLGVTVNAELINKMTRTF